MNFPNPFDLPNKTPQPQQSSSDMRPYTPSPSINSTISDRLSIIGFNSRRLNAYSVFTDVLENIWRDHKFVFSGNFTEGWGYNTSRADGRCGYDSTLIYKKIVPGYMVHFTDTCQCPAGVTGEKVTLNEDGSVTLNLDCLHHLKAIGYIKNPEEIFTTAPGRETYSVRRTASGPALEMEHVFQCCSRPNLPLLEQLSQNYAGALAGVPTYIRPDEYVFQPTTKSTKKRPTGRLDVSMLDKALFNNLSSDWGQLYMILKFLLLEALPKPGYLGSKCFTEEHCKQLLFHLLLSRPGVQFPDTPLAAAAQEALKLMTTKKTLIRDVGSTTQLKSAVFHNAWIKLESSQSWQRISSSITALIKEIDKLLQTQGIAGNTTEGLVFHPLLLTISTVSTNPINEPFYAPQKSIMHFRDVPFWINRVFAIILAPDVPDVNAPNIQRYLSFIKQYSHVAFLCLQCLLHLKADNVQEAQRVLRDSYNSMQLVQRDFPQNSTVQSVQQILLTKDCAWQFKHKVVVKEPKNQATQNHKPQGTAFLAKYPQIRFIFFPARMVALQQLQGCIVKYSLDINFLALMNCLVVQLVPLRPKETELWRWFDSKKPMEAQELFALSLCDQHLLPDELQRLCNQLHERLSPFEANHSELIEWEYLQHLRIRVLHKRIQALPIRTEWGREEIEQCKRIAQFHTSMPTKQSIAPIMAYFHTPKLSRESVGQVWGQLRDFLTLELTSTFEKKVAKGRRGDLTRQFLAASLYGWYCLDPNMAKKYQAVLAKLNAGNGP